MKKYIYSILLLTLGFGQLIGQCNHPDITALLSLYRSTNGQNWTINTGWKEGAAGQSCDPCNYNGQPWYGLQCENGRVTCIDLDEAANCNWNFYTINPNGNNLTGSIIDSINLLTNLKYLNLSRNNISGSIPLLDISTLQYIHITHTQLSGSIPNLNLPNLIELKVSSNRFLTGGVPAFNLPVLKKLDLQGNQLNGEIGQLNLPIVKYIILRNNKLTGQIPKFKLDSLIMLDLVNNNLSGILPQFETPFIEHLWLSVNQISGIIPNYNYNNLKNLYLNNNQLTGTIPNFNLPNLIELSLYSNQLSGAVPNFNFPKLQRLLLHNNLVEQMSAFSFPSLKKDSVYSAFFTQERGLRSHNNRLTFDDILPNMHFATNATFIYSPQDSFYRDTTILAEVGKSLTINLGIDVAITDNLYKWYKNGILIDSVLGSNKRIFSNIQETDAGVWTCRVSNPRAPLLILQSRKIIVQTVLCSHPDLAGLLSLYRSTNGQNWTNNSGWKEGAAGASCDPCNYNGQPWYGLQCENGRVTCIDLDGRVDCFYEGGSGNNLSGTLNDSLNLATELKVLNLSNNNLQGSLPNYNHKKLKYLVINSGNSSKLSGPIPTFDLPECEVIILMHNQLTGPIPTFITPKISVIWLNNNRLSGQIPNFNYPGLSQLILNTNELTGEIPNFNLPNLGFLALNVNQLSGSIPNFNLPRLSELILYGNRLTGSIPSFNLPLLRNIDFNDNKLSGCIPPSFKRYCDSIVVPNPNNIPGATIKVWPTVNLSNNSLLPWQGDFTKFCATNGSFDSQRGSPCNNKNPQDGDNDIILVDCTCGQEKQSLSCLPSYLPKENLLAYYPFCSSTLDASGNGQHGIIVNGTASYRKDTSAPSNEYMFFDGRTSIEVPHNDVFNAFPLTVNLWMKSSHPDPGHMINKYIATAWNGWSLYSTTKASGYYLITRNDAIISDFGFPLFESTTKVNDDKWHMITFVVDSIGGYIYIDGQLEDTQFWAGRVGKPSINTPIRIGLYQEPTLPFYNGNLDEIGIWNRRMNLEEIQDLYNKRGCDHPDLATLIALYDSTDGPNWKINTGWIDGKAGINCDPCNGWHGVSCEGGRVVGIDLPTNELRGNLPDLSKLTELNTLIIHRNGLTGNLNFISNNLKLKLFNGDFNNFSGNFPNLQNLKDLNSFVVTGNSIVGPLSDLSNNLQLRHLAVGGNNLSGSIPDLSKNTDLIEFTCDRNQLSGSIPNLTKNLKLRAFDCSSNMLTGQIPDLSNNKDILWFSCADNSLTGQVPNISNNIKLQNFDVSKNRLSGRLPNLSSLLDIIEIEFWPKGLYFDQNDFSGCFDPSHCKFKNIKVSFLNNPKLPFSGDHTRFCNGQSQNGATCDDGNPNTVQDAIFGSTCTCSGFARDACENWKLNDDFIVITNQNFVNVNYRSNDQLLNIPNISSFTYTLTTNIISQTNNSIVVNNVNNALSISILKPWPDTIILRYTLTTQCGGTSVSKSANIYLVHQDQINQAICKSVSPNKDIIGLNLGEKTPVNLVANDFIYGFRLIEPNPSFKYAIKNIISKSNHPIAFSVNGSTYSVQIDKEWVDTLYATYDLCLTSPCDTCVTSQIAFYNKALDDITLTTIFSPDGDGINDVLRFSEGAVLPESRLEIFNRYGDRIYSVRDYTNDWDARGYAGGVYYYVLTYKGLVIKRPLTIVK